MSRVARLSVSMFVVLNKADYLSADPTTASPVDGGLDGHQRSELTEALEFTARGAADAACRPARVYPLSARAALMADRHGRPRTWPCGLASDGWSPG